MVPPTETRVHGIFDMSSEFVDRMAALRPMTATYQGLPGHDHRWDDLSPAGGREVIAFIAGYQKRMAALPPAEDPWAKLAIEVMSEHLRLERAYYEDGDDLLDLNNIASTFQSMRQVFDLMNTTTREGWENIASRLETIDAAIDGYRETLDEGRRQGRTVSVRQVRAAVEQGHINAGPTSYFQRLSGQFAKAGVGDAALAARIEAGAAKARAAYEALAQWLETTYLPAATPKDGVGRERYLRQTRRFLGMTIDPEETYAWGWEQVRSLEREMKRVAAEIAPGKTLAEVFALLKHDKSRCAPDREAFIRLMSERQESALADLDGRHFDIPDEVRRVEVKIAPPGGALGAYYIQPSEDFTRPGTVWYSLAPDEVADIPLYGHITTAYHEGFPGHHLQCGTQVALAENLSRLHRLSVWDPGYGEGWALYTELLMHELGYFEKPEYVLGMLGAQMFRACRVVIDIGSHLDLRIPEDETDFHARVRGSGPVGLAVLRERVLSA